MSNIIQFPNQKITFYTEVKVENGITYSRVVKHYPNGHIQRSIYRPVS